MPRRRTKDKNRLTLHQPTEQFRKRVHGKDHYFGTDPDAAMAEWLRVKDALLARLPYPITTPDDDGGDVADLYNAYLHPRRDDVDAGKLTPRQ